MRALFKIPIELHYSQTCSCVTLRGVAFKIPIELHYSQTAIYF